jgi:hypothetical protein
LIATNSNPSRSPNDGPLLQSTGEIAIRRAKANLAKRSKQTSRAFEIPQRAPSRDAWAETLRVWGRLGVALPGHR